MLILIEFKQIKHIQKAITFNALFPLFVVVMPQQPRPPVLLMSLWAKVKKKKVIVNV